MNFKLILPLLTIITVPMIVFHSYSGSSSAAQTGGTVIQTFGNPEKIAPDETCKLTITCYKNGQVTRTFENINFEESSLTGTPGYLMYENFIGWVKIEDSKSGMMGSGKKLNFCNGPCKRK